MHCDGCEKLLNKDFNICSGCHMMGRYKSFHQMHPFINKTLAILNHTGNKTLLRKSRCPCKNGKECVYCGYCTGCSCRCHQRFTVHYRFMEQSKELELLQQAESIVGSQTIPHFDETRSRLLSLIYHQSADVQSDVVDSTDTLIATKEKKKEGGGLEVDLSNLHNSTRKVKSEVTSARISLETSKYRRASASSGGVVATFHCPHCDKDFNYTSAQTAGASFSNHLRCCGQLQDEKAGTSPDTVLSSSTSSSSTQTSAQQQLHSSGDTQIIDPTELPIGSSVVVQCEQGREWYASILLAREKGGVQGFHIHYRGTKKKRKALDEVWVPAARVLRICSP